MKPFFAILLILASFTYMTHNSAKTDRGVAMYEQELNRKILKQELTERIK